MFIAGAAVAGTTVEGLKEQLPAHYVLSLELSGNDSYSYLIRVGPVNHVSLHYLNSATRQHEKIFDGKLTPEEYKLIYQKAYGAIASFQIPEKPHYTEDATHYMLSLELNRREISIKYYSVSQIKDVSPDIYDILEITNRYLPEDKKLKY